MNSTAFVRRNYKALSWLHHHALHRMGRICVREFDFDHRKRTPWTNTWRYLEVPHVQTKYTYIGDIDILLTESVLDPKRYRQMSYFKIPYSNIIRQNKTRLTGLMLVNTSMFYTTPLINAQKELDASGNDEEFLYRLVKAAGHGLPVDTSDSLEGKLLSQFRPQHGIHLSYNRGPGKRLCQTLTLTMASIRHLLSDHHVGEFVCHDQHAYDRLSTVTKIVYDEELGNMSVREGICKPNLAP